MNLPHCSRSTEGRERERSGKLISNHCFKIHCNFLLVLSWNEFLSSTANFSLLFPLLVRRRLVRLKEDLKLVSGSFFFFFTKNVPGSESAHFHKMKHHKYSNTSRPSLSLSLSTKLQTHVKAS